MTRFEIAVFDGDGIGPEVMDPTLELLQTVGAAHGLGFDFNRLPAGAGHYVKTGEALPEASVEAARAADAVLLAAAGLPGVRYPDGTEIVPQITLRILLDLYAGVRPVFIPEGWPTPLAAPGPVDFVLVRESTEGLFHTMGAGHVDADKAQETLQITRETTRKLSAFAFALAERRKAEGRGPGKVTCIDKANVFRAFAFMREVFMEEAANWPALTADAGYVDAVALWMVQSPQRFDVAITENMFGDILSDLGAGLMGGLGVAPSADIGDDHAVFQPCHGTAPDIMGQGLANPVAMILSGAMMLDWLGETRDAPAA
ncbi:MAG: isocitrate/isopropylmalate family dehydrogenase, partial [Pseudomonadota bacterium]